MSSIYYNDFKNLNYWTTRHKLYKIREMVNRLYADYKIKLSRVKELELEAQKLKSNIDTIPEIIPTPIDLCDLTITNMTKDISNANALRIDITVKNIGLRPSIACNLKNEIAGNIYNLNIPSLEIDEQVILSLFLVYESGTSATVYTLISTADSTHSNQESDYLNNTKSSTIWFPTGIPSPHNILPPSSPNPPNPNPGYPWSALLIYACNPEMYPLYSLGCSVQIYVDGNNKGVNNAAPIFVLPGSHTVTAVFNGMTITTDTSAVDGETIGVFLMFPRIDITNQVFSIDSTIDKTQESYALILPIWGGSGNNELYRSVIQFTKSGGDKLTGNYKFKCNWSPTKIELKLIAEGSMPSANISNLFMAYVNFYIPPDYGSVARFPKSVSVQVGFNNWYCQYAGDAPVGIDGQIIKYNGDILSIDNTVLSAKVAYDYLRLRISPSGGAPQWDEHFSPKVSHCLHTLTLTRNQNRRISSVPYAPADI